MSMNTITTLVEKKTVSVLLILNGSSNPSAITPLSFTLGHGYTLLDGLLTSGEGSRQESWAHNCRNRAWRKLRKRRFSKRKESHIYDDMMDGSRGLKDSSGLK